MSYFNTDGKEQWGQKCQDQFCSHGRKSHIDDSAAAAAAKSLQSCSILCDPIDGSPPGSPVPGILQARTLEWVAISFSNALKWKVKVQLRSGVWLVATPRTAAHRAPPHGIFQARVLEWGAIAFSDRWLALLYCFPLQGFLPRAILKQTEMSHLKVAIYVCVQLLSCIWLFVTSCAVPARLLSPWHLSRQEYWSGLPFPTPGDLSDPEIEPTSLASPRLTGRFFTTSTTWGALL